ncbi:MAG: mercury(II) reductase, partial [Rhodothermales bacterium]
MKWPNYLKNRLVVFGGLGTAIAAICCFTPVLVWGAVALGLAGIVAYLDFVLLPLLAVALVVTYAGIRQVKKGHGAGRSEAPSVRSTPATPSGSPGDDRQGEDPPSETYDLVVIGGGSAAFAAAVKTSELGGRAVIVNSGLPIGGTCVNVGCVPSKTFVRAGESAYRARQTPFDGIRTEGGVSDFGAVSRQTQALVRSLRQEKYVDVVSGDPNVTIIEERARIEAPHVVEVSGQQFQARNILIATGARTYVPDIPGLTDAGYLTNEELYSLERQPDHLIVLGGRYVALENAQAFARLGSRVTILQRSDRILPSESADLTDALTMYLRDEGIEVRTGVTTRAVRRDEGGIVVEIEMNGEERLVRGSHLLLATGRQGNTDDLGLEALGIEIGPRGFLPVDDALGTGAAHVFGAGDVIGEPMFVYTAAYEGALAARNAMEDTQEARDYAALPWVVFTDPQLAGVGLDETQATEAGIEIDVAKISLENVPRSIAARDTRGFIKLIRDRATDRLVGARILAPEGSELLMEVTLAIKHGITVRELTESFHPYLTLSEGIKLAAISFNKDVRKLSCCA